MKDLYNILTPVVALTPTALLTATTAGTSVATSGYEGVLFVVEMGIPGDTLSGSKNYEFDVQDSPDGSTWTAVADMYVQYAVGTANGATNVGAGARIIVSPAAASTFQIGYLGIQPYVRINVLVTGSMSTGTAISAIALLGFARSNPAGQTIAP